MAGSLFATHCGQTESVEAVVKRARPGDAEAYGDLYQLFYREFTCYFFYRTGNALAEILV